MVFNGFPLYSILSAILLLWLAAISFIIYRLSGHYNKLTKGTSKQSLREVLEILINTQKKNLAKTGMIQGKLESLEEEVKLHIQKIGIVRFNPFSDTGGNQSFTIAMLDGEDNGFVMTSLYARSGNRWYIKHIKSGKSIDIDLSKEETQAIKKSKYVKELKS